MRGFWALADRAGQTRDLDGWLTAFSDDVTWEAIEDAPDAGSYRGLAGVGGYLGDWLETVDDIHFQLRELSEVGDFVVTSQLMTATVKGTDAKMELQYATAVRIVDGKIVHGKEFREHADALAYAEAQAG